MSDTNRQSWDEAIDALRRAANEVRSAVGRDAQPSAEEDAAAARLKEDVSRLEQAAGNLRGRFTEGFEAQRERVETSFEKERAQQSADQLRAALEELVSIATRLTADVASTAGESVKQADPELKRAISVLEDVVRSAAAWARTIIDPPGRSGRETSGSRPPLEDM